MSSPAQPRTALLTGCSSGIGRALALEFASRGVNVIATARNLESVEELERESPRIKALRLDVCDAESISRLHAEVSELAHGKLAYLVNNAGTHYAATAVEVDLDKVRSVFETNVFGVMAMCKAFADLLIAGRGTIIQIGSVTRAVPVVWQSPYNATKAALSQYTNTLRLELEPFGVNVCEIVTGYVKSNILRDGLQSSPDSRYLPIKDHVARMKSQGNYNGMPADVYAQRVADQVMRRAPPSEFWEGGQAWRLRFLVTYLPLWMSRRIFAMAFKLGLLRNSSNVKKE